MKKFIATILLVSVLAGCLGGDQDGESTDRTDYEVPAAALADAQETLDDLYFFSKTYSERAGNTAAHLGARDWLAQELNATGLEVWRQEFTQGIPQENIVGIHWGTVDPNQWVIIGGHYDMTVNGGATPARAASEGAYDDGSGTIITLNLAKAWSQVNTSYTIAFVMFDGEERGLQGSGAFAEAMFTGDHPYSNETTIRGMINVDMIGLNWPGVDAPIYLDTNSENMKQTVDENRTAMGMPDDMIRYQGISLGRSDYAHFIGRVPTAFFISNFEEWQAPGDLPVLIPQGAYPFWHLEDTWETMVLMAGSEADLRDGFQVALDLSTSLLHRFAAEETTDLDWS